MVILETKFVTLSLSDYQFARFNKRITMLEYTNEQYTKYFNNDTNWTKEETDQLWRLCKEFDLRFIVIADRFEGNKTIEDLKERYYTVS
jgi:DNA methyltransferase 1-associated protein 1